MKKSKCLLTYHRFYTNRLGHFANTVFYGIYDNATVFVKPPISMTDFKTIQTTYTDAAVDYSTYGITKRTAFYTAKEQLMATLDTLADYVNTLAKGDVSIIALSGFDHMRTEFQSSKALPLIENFKVKRTESIGEFVVTIPSMLAYGEVNYCCICAESKPIEGLGFVNGQLKFAENAPVMLVDFNKSRHKVFNKLKPGVLYYIYVFAVNAVSVSPVSGVRQIMAA